MIEGENNNLTDSRKVNEPVIERIFALQDKAWQVLYSNPKLALQLALSAQKLRREAGDEEDNCLLLRLLGNCYYQMGNYSRSLDYYRKSLRLSESLCDDETTAANIGNIGSVHQILGNHKQALHYYKRSLSLYVKLGNLKKIGALHGNIGNTYSTMGKSRNALSHQYKAIQILKKLEDRQGLAYVYGNIGNDYRQIENYKKGAFYYRKSLAIAEELGIKRLLVINNTSLADIQIKSGKYKGLSSKLKTTLKLAREIGSRDQLMIVYARLSDLYEKKGNWKIYAKYLKKYHELEKELKNEEAQRKAARFEMQKKIEFKEKEAEIERLRNVELKKAFEEIEVRNKEIQEERMKAEKLLLNILPVEVADELKDHGYTKARLYDNVTVMFTDFKEFTKYSARLSPQELVDELHECFKRFDSIVEKYKVEKIKTIGDAYMAVSGLPVADPCHAEKMVRTAQEISSFMKERRKQLAEKTFEIRIGIHTGTVVAGVVGSKKFVYDVWGDTVNIATRMEQNCDPGNINISAETYKLICNIFNCKCRGDIEVKNKGSMKMYYVY